MSTPGNCCPPPKTRKEIDIEVLAREIMVNQTKIVPVGEVDIYECVKLAEKIIDKRWVGFIDDSRK